MPFLAKVRLRPSSPPLIPRRWHNFFTVAQNHWYEKIRHFPFCGNPPGNCRHDAGPLRRLGVPTRCQFPTGRQITRHLIRCGTGAGQQQREQSIPCGYGLRKEQNPSHYRYGSSGPICATPQVSLKIPADRKVKLAPQPRARLHPDITAM
jgi:hypothetical protein